MVLLFPCAREASAEQTSRTEFLGMKRTHFRCTDSTQTQAQSQIELLEPNSWLLFTADEQTQGRGQYDRRWASPKDVNIYATYVCTLASSQSRLLFHVPQVTTLAIAKTLEHFGFSPKIKWINDLMLNHKKMCGVLCGSSSMPKSTEHLAVLIGIGINVNMPREICESLDQPVTSLFVEAGKVFDKEEVLKKLSYNLQELIEQLKNFGFDPFLHDLNERLAFLGERITIEQSNPTRFTTGLFEGIDSLGQMVLRQDSGAHLTLNTGRIVRS